MLLVAEKFKRTDLFVMFALTSAFCQEYNDLLYLKHRTFYKLLSARGKVDMEYLYRRYRLDLTSTNDPIDFVSYLNNLRNQEDFRKLCDEINVITNALVEHSKLSNVFEEDLRYVMRCYYREEDNAVTHSIFENTMLSVLGNANMSFTDLRNNSNVIKTLKYLKQKDNYAYETVKACAKKVCNEATDDYHYVVSALLSLMIYVIFSACKTKPKRFTWSDIINQLYEESSMFDQGVFELCYL